MAIVPDKSENGWPPDEHLETPGDSRYATAADGALARTALPSFSSEEVASLHDIVASQIVVGKRWYEKHEGEPDRLRKFQGADGAWWGERPKTECFDADQWLNFGSSADQTANFSRLSDEMVAAATDGRSVHLVFPHGVKARLEGDVTLDVPNMRIDGNGALLENYTDSREIPILRIPNPRDVDIVGLRFDGRRDMKSTTIPSAPNHRAILMEITEESSNFWLDKCYVTGFLDHTIIQQPMYGADPNLNTRGRNFIATRNVFENSGDPWNDVTGASGVCLMTFAGASQAIFDSNYFLDCVHPIKVDSTARSRRRLLETNPGLSVEDGDWTGFDHILTRNRYRLTSDLEIVLGNGRFMDIQGCERVLCTHNIMDGAASAKHFGIDVFTSQDFAFCRDILIAFNDLLCANRVVTVYQSERVSVYRNTIKQPSGVSAPAVYIWNSDGTTVQVPEDEDFIEPRTIIDDVWLDDNTIIVPSGQVVWFRNNGPSADMDKFRRSGARRNIIRMGDNPSDELQIGISFSGAMWRPCTSDNDISGGRMGIACQGGAQDLRFLRDTIDSVFGVNIASGATGRVDYIDASACTTPLTNAATGVKMRFNEGAVTSSVALDLIQMDGGRLTFGRTSTENYKHALCWGGPTGTYLWPDETGAWVTKTGSAPTSNSDGTSL